MKKYKLMSSFTGDEVKLVAERTKAALKNRNMKHRQFQNAAKKK